MTDFAFSPGDLFYTATPTGVGALPPGDGPGRGIDGLGVLRNTIGPR